MVYDNGSNNRIVCKIISNFGCCEEAKNIVPQVDGNIDAKQWPYINFYPQGDFQTRLSAIASNGLVSSGSLLRIAPMPG